MPEEFRLLLSLPKSQTKRKFRLREVEREVIFTDMDLQRLWT